MKILALFNLEKINQINFKNFDRIVAPSKILTNLKLHHTHLIALEEIIDLEISEMNFKEQAYKHWQHLFQRSDIQQFYINGVSPFESAASSITLYYLKKWCKYIYLAQSFIKVFEGSKIYLKNLGHPIADAIHILLKIQKKHVVVLQEKKCPINIKNFTFQTLWFLKEFLLSLKLPIKKAKNSYVLMTSNVNRQMSVISPLAKLFTLKNIDCCILAKNKSIYQSHNFEKVKKVITWNDARNLKYFFNLIYYQLNFKKVISKLKMLQYSSVDDVYIYAIILWYKKNGAQSIRALELAKGFFDKNEIKAVIVTDVVDFETRSFTLMAQRKRIPSLCIQYGLAAPSDSEWQFSHNEAIGAIDSQSAAIIAQITNKNDNIHLTGNPRFDSYQDDPLQKKLLAKKYRVSNQKKIIGFFSAPYVEEGIGRIEGNLSLKKYKEMMRGLIETIKSNDHWHLFIKPHPEEKIDIIKDFVLANSKSVTIVEDGLPATFINACDLIITLHSTTGYETLYFNKPLIILDLIEGRLTYDYTSYPNTHCIQDLNSLAQLIYSSLDSKNLQPRTQELVRNSSEICLSIIKKLTKTS